MLNNLQNKNTLVYALRVHGGNPEEVSGDVIWCGADTKCSYYVVLSEKKDTMYVYYKEENGDLSLSYYGRFEEVGL